MQDNKLIPQITILSRIPGYRTCTTPTYQKVLLSWVSICQWVTKQAHYRVTLEQYKGAAVAEWLSSWLAEQEVRGSIPRLAT